MFLRKNLLAALFAIASLPVFAQANGVPYAPPNGGVPGSQVQFVRRPTFTAAIVALAPAASTTDFFTISGSATRAVQVLRADCTGTSTAAGSEIVQAVMRSTANTAGTATTPAITPLDSSFPNAATAVVKAYTANPTLGTIVGTPVRVFALSTGPVTAGGYNTSARFDDSYLAYPVTLRGAAQTFALNGNGVTFPAGSAISCAVTWTEL